MMFRTCVLMIFFLRVHQSIRFRLITGLVFDNDSVCANRWDCILSCRVLILLWKACRGKGDNFLVALVYAIARLLSQDQTKVSCNVNQLLNKTVFELC